MKINKSDLHAIGVKMEQYPDDNLPEIAFAGRSNVGKSSFINSMINRVNLARTSGKPGKTRTVNFYIINESFRFVDLPGYGYAQVSKAERNKWKKIIDEYLTNRKNLIEIALVVDIRHEPSAQDLIMYEWILGFGFRGLVIATKSDKISRGNWHKHINVIKKKLNIKDDNLVIPYSSTDKKNREKAWEIFGQILNNKEKSLDEDREELSDEDHI